MAICGPAAIPHSFFLGGPWRWTDLDRAKQREWHKREQERCAGCGVHPELVDVERGGDPNALELSSTLCVTCEQLDRQRDQFQKQRLPGEHQIWRRRTPTSDEGGSVG
jgi:hypothetical protein